MSADATLEVVCERLHMAMTEAGHPCIVRPWTQKGVTAPGFWPLGDDTQASARARAWKRALDLVGVPNRCLPCHLTEPLGEPRISPDCEGTGLCAS